MLLPPLTPARLLRRYKRFLADVELADGSQVTAWCPNPGAMSGCMAPGWPVSLSFSADPRRKLAWTWEVSHAPDGPDILVHTGRTNALAREAIEAGLLPGLGTGGRLRSEVRVDRHSRMDFLLEADDGPPCWIEVKAVTLPTEVPGLGAFPDARTARGRKHLDTLMARVAAGERAVQLFVMPRGDLDRLRAAREVDPAYADALDAAAAAGVELRALRAHVDGREVTPLGPGEVLLGTEGPGPR